MEIIFDEITHTYLVDGEFADVSVTRLLAKHHLAPDYSKANREDLAYYAERGTLVHKRIENLIKGNEVFDDDYSKKYNVKPHGDNFMKWFTEQGFDIANAEQMLAIRIGKKIIAGTADFMAIKDGVCVIGDHKNTASFDREYVTWQVNLLDYMARKMYELDNGLKWTGATKFYCFKYEPNTEAYNFGEMKLIELAKIDDTEIVKLLKAEATGEIYGGQQLSIAEDLKIALIKAETELAEIEEARKVAKERSDELREKLCEAMEAQGILKWETPTFSVSYIAPLVKTTIDSKKLQAELPDVYKEYTKQVNQKACIKVFKKGEKTNETK